jgi:hypothetical protein
VSEESGEVQYPYLFKGDQPEVVQVLIANPKLLESFRGWLGQHGLALSPLMIFGPDDLPTHIITVPDETWSRKLP